MTNQTITIYVGAYLDASTATAVTTTTSTTTSTTTNTSQTADILAMYNSLILIKSSISATSTFLI